MALSRLRNAFACSQSGDGLRGAADVAHARKDVCYGVRMAFSRTPGHGVFSKHLLIAAFVSITGRAFHAEFCRNSANDDRSKSATAQLQVEISAIECAPLPFE